MKKTKLAAIAISAMLVAGCNSTSNEAVAEHKPSTKYSKYSCSSLNKEIKNLKKESTVLAKEVDRIHDSQFVTEIVFGFLFWPYLLIKDGNKKQMTAYESVLGDLKVAEKQKEKERLLII